jgi:DNA-directed RNA polymerase subunit M/transcription elongation factor TFIIS
MKKFIRFLKKYSAEIVAGFLFFMLFTGIFIVFLVGTENKKQEINNYNNGKCTECNGDYVLFEVIGHKNYTTYIYKCENCGHAIETHFIG